MQKPTGLNFKESDVIEKFLDRKIDINLKISTETQ